MESSDFPIDVGCKGFVCREQCQRCLKISSLDHRERNCVLKKVQETVERASHWIWMKSWLETT